MKKGQVTLYVIIAIVIVAAVGGFAYLRNISPKSGEIVTTDVVKTARAAMDSCAEQSSKDAIMVISLKGGYGFPDYSIPRGIFDVAYWYNQSNDISPGIDRLNSELSYVACSIFVDCINSKNFGSMGNNFTAGNCSAVSNIMTDYTALNLNYPMSLDSNGKTYIFREFSEKFNVKLGRSFAAAKLIVAEQAKHPDFVCLTCMANVGVKNNLMIDIGSTENTYILTLTDEESTIYTNQSYEFDFAMKI